MPACENELPYSVTGRGRVITPPAATRARPRSPAVAVRACGSQRGARCGAHVDILINNAGVALLGPSNAATEAEFDETFALNVKVPFFLVASLAPAMAQRGWGSIVNVSTMVASFGQAGMAMYGASRAAAAIRPR